MKVIQVVGFSGSGKTGFIERLIPLLREKGEVAVIKHLGEHAFPLEEDKDTTRFFRSGATCSVGIDAEKAVLVTRDIHLESVLDTCADAGIEYAVVEGFKTIPYPRVVIGDLEGEGSVLRNPAPEEVVRLLPFFADHRTLGGLVKELKKMNRENHGGAIVTFTGLVREGAGRKQTGPLDIREAEDEKMRCLKRKIEEAPGILGVRVHHRNGRLSPGEEIGLIAVLAEHRKDAINAIACAMGEEKTEAEGRMAT